MLFLSSRDQPCQALASSSHDKLDPIRAAVGKNEEVLIDATRGVIVCRIGSVMRAQCRSHDLAAALSGPGCLVTVSAARAFSRWLRSSWQARWVCLWRACSRDLHMRSEVCSVSGKNLLMMSSTRCSIFFLLRSPSTPRLQSEYTFSPSLPSNDLVGLYMTRTSSSCQLHNTSSLSSPARC